MLEFLRARWGEATTNHGLAVLVITLLQAAVGGQPTLTIVSMATYGLLNILLPEAK
ncbi:MAG TPA: hypothetical protein VN802_08675 [Stellaceae bacterium]|nr:hypothetical protein [Stellaceae bacterium]